MNDIKQEVFEIKQKNSWNKTDLTIMLAEEANIPKIRAFRVYQHIDRYHSRSIGKMEKSNHF